MSEPIRMTVVINPLVSPLTHEALSTCRSARERAMRLRALAESALRQAATGGDRRDDRVVTSHAAWGRPAGMPRNADTTETDVDPGFQTLHVQDPVGTSDDQLAALGSDLAAYL